MTGQLAQGIYFGNTVVYPGSYLNDVRVDATQNYAYLSESGQGALLVVTPPRRAASTASARSTWAMKR
ncbi:MAG: hypothetical protein EOO56_13855 [Hymenobacter sp.]|nr:MAG: hypothetical protein EOO56_13855 [Hymenobacter sp.]